MRQTSRLLVLTCLFYVIITVVPVFAVSFVHGQLEDVAILATLTLNYGTKIRSNEKIPFFLERSKYLKSTKSVEGLYTL